MDRMMDRDSQRYDKRSSGDDRPDLRPKYPANDSSEYYPLDTRRRDYPSPGRGLDVPRGYNFDRSTTLYSLTQRTLSTDESRGYPLEDCPPFMAPKGLGQNDPRIPPGRRSPEPRYNYRASEKPFYPPREG
ncbi:hypothetical protein EG68_03617 [Paragonimus skrjabini miyazakii]|uniref:Uncharacterized protein n=1 Tax=Paragonimus skrjabini miyazakii TaxID=59628 RepID=A0A8S9YUQ4_9TREM|nr:hypothetical protein EG68_03617 [Paragonimus skrjabini miyazakii]